MASEASSRARKGGVAVQERSDTLARQACELSPRRKFSGRGTGTLLHYRLRTGERTDRIGQLPGKDDEQQQCNDNDRAQVGIGLLRSSATGVATDLVGDELCKHGCLR